MQNYSIFQKFLHDLLLRNNFIKKSLYEIEKICFLKEGGSQIKNEVHVFITGLPRSGTTALLNFLYDTNQFSSYTYADMPFIVASNLFSKIKIRTNTHKKERLHQDGILYDLNSPEAFDEIFFSTFNESEIKEELLNFISLFLLKKRHKRYLSKNNLNYRRINLIQSILPNSIFLIPFRKPLQHAYSLLSQHKNFIKYQNQDDFIRRYMSYLGHNEFGINHKSWNTPELYSDYIDLNYWLEQWVIFYENFNYKHKKLKNCCFVCYENLKSNDNIKFLIQILNLNKKSNFQFKIKQKEIPYKYDHGLYLRAEEVYDALVSYSG